MVNPYRGILLNNRYYNYTSESYHEDIELKNNSVEAQNSRHFNAILGAAPEIFTLSFLLENTKTILCGSSIVGATTWLGVSQLADFKSYIGTNAAGMSLIFVTPYGATFAVVPTGKYGVDIFNPPNPSTVGTEFRISLTLEST